MLPQRNKLLFTFGLALLLGITISTAQTEKSESANEDVIRDPFWPVGYWPKKPVTATNANVTAEAHVIKEVKLEWPKLKVKGISSGRGGRHYAAIEGIGTVEKGNIIGKRKNNVIYRWKIADITATGVKFTKLDARPVENK